MALEAKKRLDSLISFVNTKLGINATDITEAMQALLDEECAIIDRSITKISNHKVKYLNNYAFANCVSLKSVDCPSLMYIAEWGFYDCVSLESVDCPSLISIALCAFACCVSLESVDFPSVTYIGYEAFSDCDQLKKVILRKNSIVGLESTSSFRNTPIASGEGYIYVPRSLVDSYKTATNWVQFADQFRALEDYTVDGTITGALDESKI